MRDANRWICGVTFDDAECNAVSMKPTEQRYRVGDVEVTLIREGTKVRWECGQCRRQCQHILQAAAWMTLQSWMQGGESTLH